MCQPPRMLWSWERQKPSTLPPLFYKQLCCHPPSIHQKLDYRQEADLQPRGLVPQQPGQSWKPWQPWSSGPWASQKLHSRVFWGKEAILCRTLALFKSFSPKVESIALTCCTNLATAGFNFAPLVHCFSFNWKNCQAAKSLWLKNKTLDIHLFPILWPCMPAG